MGFEATVERYQRRVYTFARYFLGNGAEAEEVTQEVFLKLWQHREQLDHTSLEPWILRVTRNACYDLLRRRRCAAGFLVTGLDHDETAEAASDEPGPEERAQASDFRRRLLAALGRLEEPYRSVLILREVQGLQYQQIADALALPLNTVRVYIHRGRKRLRERLTEKERIGHAVAR